jgi:tRNA modification GTPase
MAPPADCTGEAATIFALSSAPGKAGVAVIRLSGPRAGPALAHLAGRVPAPRRATVAQLRDPGSGEALDQALVLWLPGPGSFTGEDVAELHIHGGRATVAGVLDALGREEGLRLAEPGEFARRAFAGGRLDLAEAEALADLIDADTAAQRRFALRGMAGGIGARAEAWRGRALEALALAEAAIDFADEGDVPAGLSGQARQAAAALAAEIAGVLDDDGGRGERLRSGAVIVVAGPPNVGKSSLLNHLARREAAIVSPHAGTTRDAVEVHLDLGGYPAMMVDTAGQREAADPVEQEGVRRARARAAAADLVLWLDDDPAFAAAPPAADGAPLWRVRTKLDLAPEVGESPQRAGDFAVSTVRGDGVAALVAALAGWLRQEFEGGPEPLIARARHRAACEEAMAALGRAAAEAPPELLAEELRLAARSLGRIAGRVDVEDVLDRIFASFCIGK